MTSIARLAAGLALAAAVALVARRAGSLSTSGAVAATLLGALAVGVGWGWGALLVGFFVGSTALSRVGAAAKAARTDGIVAKGGRRDAWQVIANGGPFGLAAIGALLLPHPAWGAVGAGSLAAAAADTWGTELGTLARRPPRSILTWRPVPTGTSGGVSAAGSLATVAGALFVGTLALACGFGPHVAGAAALGGVVGALADSLLGATLQARRRCPACGTATERIVHSCGARTEPAGGVRWMDNDVVNVLAAAVGGAATALLAWGR